MRNDTPLLGLKNIGPTVGTRLKNAGVRTVGELRELGAAEAFRRVKAAHPGVTIPVCYYLYSLQGALLGVHWDAVPARKKKELLRSAGVAPRSRRSKPAAPPSKRQRLR